MISPKSFVEQIVWQVLQLCSHEKAFVVDKLMPMGMPQEIVFCVALFVKDDACHMMCLPFNLCVLQLCTDFA